MDSEIPVEIKRVKVGRPKRDYEFDKKKYFAEYYEKNKVNTKGDICCPHCNLLYSKANKSRHNKKYHPEVIKPKSQA